MVRWGILGAGNIARRFIKGLAWEPDGTLVAASFRSEKKAGDFAALHPQVRTFLSHEELLADPEVDAVYLALPHGLHAEWAIRTIEAGKAVLCEKPAVLSAAEMRAVADAAHSQHVLFMEAMKTRFVPLYRDLKEQLATGVIGPITGLTTSLCNLVPPEHLARTYLIDPRQGGVLWDSGIYCACWLDDLLPGEIERQSIDVRLVDGIDYAVDARLTIGGVPARLVCAVDHAAPRQAVISGTRGRIVVDDLHRPEKMTLFLDGQEPQETVIPYEHDDFYSQIHHFTGLLRSGKTESDIMPLAASIRCAEILDRIREGFAPQP